MFFRGVEKPLSFFCLANSEGLNVDAIRWICTDLGDRNPKLYPVFESSEDCASSLSSCRDCRARYSRMLINGCYQGPEAAWDRRLAGCWPAKGRPSWSLTSTRRLPKRLSAALKVRSLSPTRTRCRDRLWISSV